MAEKAFLISEAQKLLAKGQVDKAISKWEEVAKAFPEGNTYNFIGDLYLKKGDRNLAVETLHKAAKIYTDEGFSLKALALYKKILNINPQDAGALIALGVLNEAKKLVPDAIRYYLAAADSLLKDRKLDEVPSVYDKILNLAPTNITLRIKIADKYTQEGFISEASREHCRAGMIHLEAGDIANAERHLAKAIEMRPTNREAIYALSEIYATHGDHRRALAFNRASLERLGDDLKLLVNTARILVADSEFDEASTILFKTLTKEPSNTDAKTVLGDLYFKTGEPQKAWKEYRAAIDELLRVGKNDAAIELLAAHKDLDPETARKKLAKVYRICGQDALAVAELMQLHDIYLSKNESGPALEVLREAYEIQPYNTDIKHLMDSIEAREAAAAHPAGWPSSEDRSISLDDTALHMPAAPETQEETEIETEAEPQPAAPGRSVELPLGTWPEPPAEESEDRITEWPSMDTIEGGEGQLETLPVEAVLNEADVFIKYGKPYEAIKRLESLKVQVPSNMDVHLRLKALYTETGDIEQAVTECMILSMLNMRLGNGEERKRYLREAYALNPSDPRLEGRLAEIGVLPQAGEQAGQPAGVHEIPSEELDDDVLSIFDEFKRGLENEIGAEDSETHYNLGIAYKEMGLTEDSIKEFQLAQRDPGFYVQASTMLGLCHMEKGQFQMAVEAFTNALKKTPAGDEGAWRLKYDLADAYEKGGKTDEARKLFIEVHGWKADYRDVAAKVAQPAPADAADKAKEKRSRVSYI